MNPAGALPDYNTCAECETQDEDRGTSDQDHEVYPLRSGVRSPG